MKSALVMFLALTWFAHAVQAQTAAVAKPVPMSGSSFCAQNRPDQEDDIKDTRALIARVQNRILTMRNAAGTVSDFQMRSALQVNADAWQDLLENLKNRIDRVQRSIDRCEAQQKIEGKAK